MNWEVRTMQSKTSYFNFTLFWKNVTRFWPLWSGYTVIWALILPMAGLNDLRNGWWSRWDSATGYGFHRHLLDSVPGVGIGLAAVMGILLAMALFSYLYQSRAACMFHSLPIRREGIFLTNYAAGVVFFLVPNTLVALLTLLVEAAAGDVSLWALGVWWLLVNGACLFFFSFAVFCAMFTGHILALPVFYAILNFLVVVVSTLLNNILSDSLYGWDGFADMTLVQILTPVWGMGGSADWYMYQETLTMANPLVFGLYVLAGVVLAVLALVIYRRRQVESAGDVVSVSWVRPIFKYGVALCSGLVIGLGTYLIVGFYGALALWASMLLWTVIGYFVAEMLLKKTFRVLHAWKGAVAAALVVVICYAGVEADLFGYESRVPAADRVASVSIYGMDSFPYDKGSYVSMDTEDPELVAKVVALHQAIVEQRGEQDRSDNWTGNWGSVNLRLSYELSDGTRLRRDYYAPVWEEELSQPGTVAYAAQQLVDDPEFVLNAYDIQEISSYTAESVDITTATGEYGYMTISASAEERQRLWQAVLQDFEEGNLGRRYLFDTEERLEHCYFNDLEFYLTKVEMNEAGERYTVSESFTVTLTTDAVHTLEELEALGVLDQVELVTYGNKVYGEDNGEQFPSTEMVFPEEEAPAME